MQHSIFRWLMVLVTATLSISRISQADEPADLVLLGGKIVTVDRQERVASAVAVRAGRIVAVGSDAEMAKLIGAGKTEVIRLDGRTVLPGFIESHCHAVGVARGSLEQDYVEISSIAELQAWIRKAAADVPAGRWIEVPRNEITRFKERRFPTPAELDAACTTHPVLYNSVSNKWVLNTRGFEELKLLDPNSKLSDGEVLRDAEGKPLLIRGGTGSIRKLTPPRPTHSREEELVALEKVLQRYNEVGITSIFERATDPQSLGLFRELRNKDRLTTRVTGTFRFSAKTADGVEKYVASLDLKPGEGDEWIKAGPLKITVDGGIHWGTTRLSERYGEKRIAFYRLADPEYRGEQFFTVAEMKTVFEAAHKLGWQMSCHVTGDEGTLRVLEALGQVAAEHPEIRQRRFTLIHAYFPSPEIVRQCADLGVCVDTQGYLYFKDADTLAEVYGPAWASRFIGLGDWVRGGVPVAVNADHMIGLDPDHAMNSFNPLLMLSIAVTRKTLDGRVYGPQQALSRLDALRTVTQWPAHLSFDEQKLGSIEVGKLADLVVLEGDYLTCPEAKISTLKVERTIVGGKTVYQLGQGDRLRIRLSPTK
ncbi:MAG: amidohydrolase family protein [Candidatus Saccharimonas sp.]|nr:amidohydrolase family protein [Planctomycetaceae bacterium]